MSDNKIKNGQLEKVSGGQTWEEELEGSRNNLPEGDVTCLNLFCQKTFNAKDNAFGFMNTSYSNGASETRAVAKCPYCGAYWYR